jgi:hypothetical protein
VLVSFFSISGSATLNDSTVDCSIRNHRFPDRLLLEDTPWHDLSLTSPDVFVAIVLMIPSGFLAILAQGFIFYLQDALKGKTPP